MRKSSWLVALVLIGATQAATVRAHKAHATAPVTELVLNSEPGDYGGQGMSYSYAEGDGGYEVFLRDLSHDGVIDDVIFSFNSPDSWDLEFETSKAGTQLERGFYDNAQRASLPKITKVSYDARGESLTVKGKKFDPTVSVIINGEMLRTAHFDSGNKISSKAIKVGSVVLQPGTYMMQVADLEGAISAPFAFSF
jgi:hypothetical protein